MLRVPYPLGYYTKWLDGRIDDPKGGWKGRGLWSTVSTRAPFHMETRQGNDEQGGAIPDAPGSAGEMIVGGPSPPSPRLRRTTGILLRTVGLVSLCAACSASGPTGARPAGGPFSSDVAFLRQHTDVVLLTDASGGAQVAVAPGYQGRVMTSTTGGSDGPSFGWIGRAAVSAGSKQPHMNVFGGEDRFWLGPEGGQYALYFKPGDPFDLDHWQVPDAFDWDKWEIASQTPTEVRFRKRMALMNYSRTPLTLDVDRTVRLLTSSDAASAARRDSGSGSSCRGVRVLQHGDERGECGVAVGVGAAVDLDPRSVQPVAAPRRLPFPSFPVRSPRSDRS